jgi:TP901 family phage tail tape measure protein
VAVFLDVGLQLARGDADKAAKEVAHWAEDVGNDISKVLGGSLSKAFDALDGSAARNELKRTQDEYAATARAAADASRGMVSSAGNVEVAIKRLHDAHDKYGQGAAQTAAAENRVVDAWARSGQAALDAAAAADVASSAHERVAAGATHMNSSMLLAAGGTVALTAATVEAGKKLFDMGEQWAQMSDKITAATGKIGADADAMVDRVAKIGDVTAAPLGNIADVYTQLGRLKDLQGSTLDDLTKQISDFDQMNKDAPLNVGVFTRAMQEFHVPADQVGKDLDVLNSAAQAGRVPLNDLVQTLQTAGPAADIAGLSFGQMANVLAVLDQSGVNVDTALQGLRLAMGNLAKDTPALQKLIKFTPDENELQRLKDVIQRIQELHAANKDIAADDLGATVFGRSWTVIGDEILQGKLNVDDLNTSIGQIGAGIEPQRQATMHFGDQWKIVENQITDALKPLSTDVFKELDSGLSQLGDWVTAHGDGVNQFFTDLANTLAVINPLTWVAELPGGFVGTQPVNDSGPDYLGKGQGPQAGAQAEHRGMPAPGSARMPGAPSAGSPTGAPTAPDINTVKPFHPLDLNPADKPPGAESYDTWISSQKAVQSALNRQADSGEQLAAAQKRQADLLAGGNATQEQVNSVSDEINKAQRDKLQADQDLTVAEQKYTEDTNKATKGRAGKSNNPFDNYDPFTAATKGSTGLVPELAGLAAAFAANEAFGNPYGKMQAAKRGEDPSNPLYTSDVNGRSTTDSSTAGGLPGIISRFFQGSAAGQAPQDATGQAPSGGASPDGSIPALVGQSPAGLQSTPSPGAPNAAAPSGIALPPPGSGAAGWRDTVAQVVDKYGPAMGVTSANRQAWIDDITKQIGTESGGNPGADNPNDTNGQGGRQHVSGLLQYLPSSYAGSGGKLTGLPYMDPIGQIAGALFAPRNPDGSPNTGAPGGIGAGHGWGPTSTPIDSGALPAPSAPPIAPPGPGSQPPGPARTVGSHWDAKLGRQVPDVAGAVVDPATGLATMPAGPPAPPSIPGLFPPPSGGAGYPLGIPGFASGGSVPSSDTVPAMLTPKEFVVNKDAAQKNRPELEAMNAGQDPHKPTPDRISPTSGAGPAPSSRQPLGSVTPPPPGPRVGQGTGSGFGIGGGIIGMAEMAAMMAAMGAAGMAEGGPVQDTPPLPGGGGGGSGGGGGGGAGGGLTAVLNRTVGYIGQLGAIGIQGAMSSLIPGASQKGGIMDGGLVSKLVGGFAGAHPSAPNTAGNTPVPLAPPPKQGPGMATGGEVGDGGDTNHIAHQTNGVHIENMTVQNGQTGQDVANDLAFKSYAGYGSR